MDPEELKEAKINVAPIFSLKEDYDVWEVLGAILTNDPKKLQEIRNRQQQLDSAHKQFIEAIDGDDETARHIALHNVARPSK